MSASQNTNINEDIILSDNSNLEEHRELFDRSFVYELAEQAAEAKQSQLEYQQRLRELENGRLIRFLTFVKRFLSNPIKGIKSLNEVPSLLKKSSVLPLPLERISAENFIDGMNAKNNPSLIHKNNPLLRYPHLKAAVIGEVYPFNLVCHAFSIEMADWEYLLEVGIEFLIININNSPIDSDIAHKAIKSFSARGIPIIYFVNDQSKNNEFAQIADYLVYETLDLQKKSKLNTTKNQKSLCLAASINPYVDNPINYSIHTNRELLVFCENSDLPLKFVNYLSGLNTNAYKISSDLEKALGEDDIKACQAAIIHPSGYSSNARYLKTVLKLVANGIPVLIPRTDATASLLGKDFPFCPPNEIDSRIKALADIQYREQTSIKWRRFVLDKHSVLSRFEELLEILDLPVRQKEKITIIHSTSRPDFLKHAFDNFKRQSYPELELILILHGSKNFKLPEIKKLSQNLNFPVKIIKRPENSLFGENLNLGLEAATGFLVTKMDDDDWYGPNHLLDLFIAWQYSQADIVGKWGNFVFLTESEQKVNFQTRREERFVHQLPGATILGSRELFLNIRFGRVKRAIDSELHRRLSMRGGRLYSTHRYNFIRVRHGDHTYKQGDETFLAHADGPASKGLNLDDSFI